MSTLKAYKYRMYPNNTQRILIHKTFGCARFIYNKLLFDMIEYYQKLLKHSIEVTRFIRMILNFYPKWIAIL